MDPFEAKPHHSRWDLSLKEPVWDCGSEKNPGPDGLNFKFIKKFWQIIKPDILRFLDEFYINRRFPRGCNASFIALIPKVADPKFLNEQAASQKIEEGDDTHYR